MKEADDINGSKKGKRRGSKTDNTNAQQRPWLFKPGQSGNPAGRPKGSRNKLADDFLKDALAAWHEHGPDALNLMAKEEPSKFCQMVANLLPKEVMNPEDNRVQIGEIKLVIIDAKANENIRTINAERENGPGLPPNETRSLTGARTIQH
jgi:Family of unknown function (DUF5681)